MYFVRDKREAVEIWIVMKYFTIYIQKNTFEYTAEVLQILKIWKLLYQEEITFSEFYIVVLKWINRSAEIIFI